MEEVVGKTSYGIFMIPKTSLVLISTMINVDVYIKMISDDINDSYEISED